MTFQPDKYQALTDAMRRGNVDPEVLEELETHLAMRIEEHVAAGKTRAEAEALARQQFGDLDRYRRETRAVERQARSQARRREWFDLTRLEVIRAVRAIGRSPGFAAAALVTLALGLGAAVTMFSILDAVVLRPLPYPAADRLVRIYHPVPKNRVGDRWNISTAEYYHFAREAKTLEAVGIFGYQQLTVMADGEAQQVRSGSVGGATLAMLGARAVAGRLLTQADSEERAQFSVLISERFWRARFGGGSEAVGSTIRVEGNDAIVVGVVADGLRLPDWVPDLWTPIWLDPKAEARNNHTTWAVARLAPGVTLATATAELAGMVPRYPERFPTAYTQAFLDRTGFTTIVVPWKDDVIGDAGRALWLVFGAVGVVLLIVCFNVGNLFIVRAQGARREAAVRAALGAERRQLAGQHLAEGAVIGVAALGLGLALSWGALRAFVAFVGADGAAPLPRLADVALGPTGVGFGVAIAMVVVGLMALGPTLLSPGPNAVLRQGGRSQTASRRDARVRAVLVVGQVTFAVVLLAAAGLMLRTFRNLQRVDPGFDPANLAVIDVALPFGRYQRYEQTTRVYRELADRVAQLPSVAAAGLTSDLPVVAGDGCSNFEYHDRPTNVDLTCVGSAIVSPGFFTAMGIRIDGRDTEWRDLDGKSGGVILSDALASRLWPEGALDRPVNGPNNKEQPPYRVVGVTRGLRWSGLIASPAEVAFFPLEPIPDTWLWSPPTRMTLVARLQGADPAAIFPEIRRIARDLDPEIAVTDPRSMADIVSRSLLRVRLMMGLLLLAATMALLLSVVGLYGVVAHVVARRTQEIGLRIALGAPLAGVRALVVRQSIGIAAVGVALGLLGAFGLTRSMQSMLYGVSASDPVTLGLAGGALLVVAVAASLGPAWRATRIDPLEALRSE